MRKEKCRIPDRSDGPQPVIVIVIVIVIAAATTPVTKASACKFGRQAAFYLNNLLQEIY